MPKKKRKGERSDNRSQVIIDLPRGSDGKRRRKVFYGHNLKEAQQKRDRWLEENPINKPIDETITVEQWAMRWLQDYKSSLRPTSYAWYEWPTTARIIPAIGNKPIALIKPIDIQKIYNELKGKSASSISQISLTLNQIFSTALDNNIIRINPVEKVKPPAGSRGKRQAITHDEIKLITKEWSGHRSGIWAMLMLYAGLRRGEMAALTWDDVNMKKGAITVRWAYSWSTNQPDEGITKTAAGQREIPIPKPLLAALSNLHKPGMRGEICRPVNARVLTLVAYRRGWNGLLAHLHKMSLQEYEKREEKNPDDTPPEKPMFTAHMLRHTYATLLYEANVDVLTAARWMGHTDPSVTMKIYTHLSNQKVQKSEGHWNEFWNTW